MIQTKISDRWNLLLPEHRVQALDWRSWEAPRLAAMHAGVKAGDIIFDIGSENGDLSALYATWAGPTGGVVLFEPSPHYWPCTRAIFEANKLPAPLGYFVGFASRTTELTLNTGQLVGEPWPLCSEGDVETEKGFSHLSQETDARPQTTLDDWCREHDIYPTVISIDVEGADLEVLKGAEGLLRTHKPLIFLSHHPSFAYAHFGTHETELFSFMHGAGYEEEYIATDHEIDWIWRSKQSK